MHPASHQRPARIRAASFHSPRRGGTPADLEEAEAAIWEMLAEPKTRDEVLRGASGAAGPGELLTALVSLELRGLVREEFGAWRRS